MDDAYCAGRIALELGGEPADSAAAAIRLAGSFATAEEGLSASQSARNLHGSGLEADIAYCARESVLSVVPRLTRMLGPAAEVASGMTYRFAFGRPPAVAARGMVATSQPLATRAGLRMLEQGGNAADAALAAAAVLCVTEPMSTGIGGDCFALVWRDGRLEALDSAGPAPRSADPLTPVEVDGPRSVTVPGAVAGWAALAGASRAPRPRRLPRGRDRRRRARLRGRSARPRRAGSARAARPSSARRHASATSSACPSSARTLRLVASDGPDGFYRGPVAAAIASASWLDEDDLAAFEPRWVEPLRLTYRGTEVVELPPPTQGVVALEALGLLERSSPSLASRIRCAKLALEDGLARVRDGADVSELIDPDYLDRRRAGRRRP